MKLTRLILAWKVPGYISTDSFLLAWIGTPWCSVPVKPENPPVRRYY